MKTAIAIAAHPDDIEFLMAGTLILLREAGYEIHYWNLANGCCGTTEHDVKTIAEIRRHEAESAAQLAGAIFHPSICNDLEIFYDRPTLSLVASVIRDVSPDVVLTHSPDDYMEDHMNACRLAVTATFARGMRNFPAVPPRAPVEQQAALYHAQPYSHRDQLGQLITPQFYVDTTDLLDRKVEMLAQHRSQKQWLDKSQGLDSYLQTLRDLDAEAGEMSNTFRYAEGWRQHLHLGFCGPAHDPIAAALGHAVSD